MIAVLSVIFPGAARRCGVPNRDGPMPFGAALRRERLAAGLSLGDLAQRVHYSKSYLSKIERGRKAPSLDLARRCDAALRSSGNLASLVPAARIDVPSLPAGPVDDQWIISANSNGRGVFSAVAHVDGAATETTTPLTWGMPPAVRAQRQGSRELGSFRLMFDEMRRLGQVAAPAVLLPVLVAQTHAVRLLAASATPQTRTTALMLAGRFAEFTGWIAQEAGDDDGALWWTARAVELAAAGGDRELGAYALVRRGLVALYRHDARETIATAVRAQAARCGPRIRGLAALLEAQGHALAGSYDPCCHALNQAATLLDEATTVDDELPVLGTTTVHDPVAMVRGWCMHDLGRPRRALEALESELAAVPDYAHRTLARIGVRYSLALVAAGEVEHSCTMVDRLIDIIVSTDSATVRVDLRRLAQELTRRHTHSAVKEIMPRLIGALRTTY
jgi:transcriptional regulator with XRE-family HTH domain